MNTSSAFAGITGKRGMKPKKLKAGKPVKIDALTPAKGKPAKMAGVMHEFKVGELRSGSKAGPKVKNRKQAIAIALSEAGKSKRGR